ncbi:MAG: hypothetical protein AB7J13_00710 [Pyrinomonadaceae bacterium]
MIRLNSKTLTLVKSILILGVVPAVCFVFVRYWSYRVDDRRIDEDLIVSGFGVLLIFSLIAGIASYRGLSRHDK